MEPAGLAPCRIVAEGDDWVWFIPVSPTLAVKIRLMLDGRMTAAIVRLT